MKLKAYNALRPKFAELLYFQLRTVSVSHAPTARDL